MKLPEKITNIVKDILPSLNDEGRSGDLVYIYGKEYILKISDDIERVENEKARVEWLSKYLPSSKNIAFEIMDNKAYYLRTYMEGENLISKRILENPLLLIQILKKVVKLLRSLDDKECPYKSSESVGNDFVHGDLCLPNILVDRNNEVVGFIDVSDAGKGDRNLDYSWMLWSFEYNLGTKEYSKRLLDELNLNFQDLNYNKYIPEEYR